jgi:hypothetical protein
LLHNIVAGTMVYWSQKLTCQVNQVHRLLFSRALLLLVLDLMEYSSLRPHPSICNVLRPKGHFALSFNIEESRFQAHRPCVYHVPANLM